MRVRLTFVWTSFFVGLFLARKDRRFYIFPLPMLGIVFEWGDPTFEEVTPGVRISNVVAGGNIIAINNGRRIQ